MSSFVLSQKLSFKLLLTIFFCLPLPPSTISKLVPSIPTKYSPEVSVLLQKLVLDFEGCEFLFTEDEQNEITFTGNRIENSRSVFDLGPLTKFAAGTFQVSVGFNVTYRRHEDIHRLARKHCSFGLLFFQDFDDKRESWLLEFIIPRYAPVLRKDQDHFLLLTPNEQVSDKILTSAKFGERVKYKLAIFRDLERVVCKTVDLYGDKGNGKVVILREFNDLDTLEKEDFVTSDLFPDFTKMFNGKVFRFAIPKVAFRFEIEKRSDGKYHPKRGFYKWWLDEAMSKFNFTYHMFYASFGGGTGKRLKNGTWVGAAGDLYYGKADCSFIVGEIYSRHKILGWSSSISYEWVVFMTHPARNSYSAKALFKPFTPLMWILFFASLGLMTIALRQVARAGFDPNSRSKDWSYFKIFNYVFASMLEQDKGENFRASSVQVLVTFWLLFAMVTTTVYRGKLVSLIAFPVKSWVPETFEELAGSHFKVALNVVGKAGAAYVLIATSSSPVFQTITNKMELIGEPEVCLERAMNEDLGCIIWKGIADYAMVKNLTDKNGRVPLQESSQIALFIGDGLVYERRAIFGEHMDRTIQAVVQMGLTMKWFMLDQEFIKKERKIWERRGNVKPKVYDYEEDGPKKLVVSQFIGLFLLTFVGIVGSFGVFWGEVIWQKRGGNAKKVGIEKSEGDDDDVKNGSFKLPSLEATEVKKELYEMGFMLATGLSPHSYWNCRRDSTI